MNCSRCGSKLHPTTEDICWPCRQALKDAEMVEKVAEVVEYLCTYLNSSIADPNTVAETFYGARTKQHRYLQGSFMDALHRFLKVYSDAPCDDRNAWAVAWAEKATQAP